MPAPSDKTFKFNGLNNVADPLRLGLKWLVTADNVDVTGTGALARRSGFVQVTSDVLSSTYATKDFQRMYGVRGNQLIRFNRDMSSSVLRSGVSSVPGRWTEVNNVVYYANGIENFRIAPDDAVSDWGWPMPSIPNLAAVSGTLAPGSYQVACTYILPDGRETGASPASQIDLVAGQALSITGIPQTAGLKTCVYVAPANSTVFQLAFITALTSERWDSPPHMLGVDLTTQFLDPPPVTATQPVVWGGRIYLMEYFPSDDLTVVWASQPLGFHLFDLNAGFFAVAGKGLMLAPHTDGLVLGTENHIFTYDGQKLTQLAEYGVVPGWNWVVDEDADANTLMFWTKRGLCSALPFSNLTRNQISVRFGASVGAAIIKSDGSKKFVAALQKGGEAFNQRT